MASGKTTISLPSEEHVTVDWKAAYEQLSRAFSPWMPWRGLTAYDFMQQPGVYLLAEICAAPVTGRWLSSNAVCCLSRSVPPPAVP